MLVFLVILGFFLSAVIAFDDAHVVNCTSLKALITLIAFIPLLPLYNNVFHKELFLLLLYHLAAKHAVNTYVPSNTADTIRVLGKSQYTYWYSSRNAWSRVFVLWISPAAAAGMSNFQIPSSKLELRILLVIGAWSLGFSQESIQPFR